MSLTNSPKFEDEFNAQPPDNPPPSGGEPDQQPPSAPQRWTRILIGVLAALLLISGLLLVVGGRGGTSEVSSGSATIQGHVVNSRGSAVTNAIVFVEGMASSVTTDGNGSFSIRGAPSGQVVIVVGVTPEAPHFVNIAVAANGIADVGQIVYQPGS